MVLPTLHLSTYARATGADRALRRRFARGEVTRLLPGVYIDSTVWESLSPDDRYRNRVRAGSLLSAPATQFSHDSAAALHGLPNVGAWPGRLHQLGERSTGGASLPWLRRHLVGLDDQPTVIAGITVTSLPRTLVDIACGSPFIRSVTMLDYALGSSGNSDSSPRNALATRDDVHSVLDSLGTYRGLVRARRAIDFADGRSGSPAESFARAQFLAIGYPAPVLQKEFFDERGSIGFVDFYWPELDLIVEYDGRVKYGEGRAFQRDISAERVLWEEKVREDRLRRVCTGFARLTREVVRDLPTLVSYLRPFGLQPRPRRRIGPTP
jgi:hypothetical protein